uniref:Uncharacterized protein n=1 Tax=Rhizophora mucronata TaxID=61149 RepID=A0A2P2PVB6_RHIMU
MNETAWETKDPSLQEMIGNKRKKKRQAINAVGRENSNQVGHEL